jgi:hypothetical protein
VLLPIETALPLLQRQAAGEPVPELWIGIRAIPAKQHMLLETVGMTTLGPLYSYDHQLLLPDLGLTPDVMTKFVSELSGAAKLRGAASVPEEPVLGPGGRWRPVLAKSANPPPRELVRWVHESSAEVAEDVVELDEAEAERWGEHLKSLLGGECTVFHELLSDTVHLDVLVFAPTPERPNPVLVTQGMSALPMHAPEGAEDMRFAELMFVLPPNWVLSGDEAHEERWYWPMRTLKVVARLPHQQDTWIAPGHTIPTGDPAVPFADNTKLCCVIVGAPLLRGALIESCELSPGKSVRLYPLVAIYEDEMSYKLEHGAEALFEKLDARKVSEVLDPKRRSVLAKRFWIV